MNIRNFISPLIQIEAKRRRGREIMLGICAVLVINMIAGVSMIVSSTSEKKSPAPQVSPVRVGAPAVVATPGAVHHEWKHHISPTYTPSTQSRVVVLQPSGATGWRIAQTSDQRVHSYGGGNMGTVNKTGASSSRAAQPVANSVVPVTSFVALQARQQLADAGATEAPQMAEMATLPTRRAPGPPNPPGPLPEDHQLVEHPLPDGVIALLVMAIIYAIGRFFTEKCDKKRA